MKKWIMLTVLAMLSMAVSTVAAENLRMLTPTPVRNGQALQGASQDKILKRALSSVKQISAADLENRNLTLILKEDFSKMTEGSETQPGETPVSGSDAMCDDNLFSTPGWSGQGLYPAGGAIGLTIPRRGGVLNTPLGVYAGKIVLKFRAKAFNGDTYLFLNICSGGILFPKQETDGNEIINMKGEDGWQDYVVEMTCQNPDDDCFIQFNGMCYRNGCLLDDIEIYRDNDYMCIPQRLNADGFTRDGFTAHWADVFGSDGYLVNLVEEKIVGTENVIGEQDFNGIDLSTGKLADNDIPEGWEFKLTSDLQITSDGGEGGSPAIMLTGEDYIQLPIQGGTFLSLSFFVKPVSQNVPSGTLYIEALDASTMQWKTWAFMDCNMMSGTGEVISVKEFEDAMPEFYAFKGLYLGIRLRVKECKDQVVIDNIKYETTPIAERRTVYEDLAASANSYTFTDLDPEAEHYFSVKSKNGEVISEPSLFSHAFGISRPVVKEPTDIDRRGGFSANWEYTPKADRYVVNIYSVDVVDSDKPEAVMLHEDFSNVKSSAGTADQPEEVGNYYDLSSLDKYIGNPGWEGRGNIIVDGMIGCAMDQTGTYELYSPWMSLLNNEGNYKVTMKVVSVPSETIIIQGTGVYEVYNVEKDDVQEITVNLSGGIYQDRLMFYSLNGYPFLIDEITVNQDLKQGDKLYTNVGKAEETGLEHRFSVDNTATDIFSYNIMAEHDAFNKTCHSEMSDMAFVEFTSGVSEIEGDGQMTAVRSLPGEIEVTLGQDTAIEVFDLAARKVADVNGAQGANSIPVAPGIYVVRAAGCSVKVIVR